jgi:DMSO/TMAO reductase YedYZ molybdopterin-dependent catalytic subunit
LKLAVLATVAAGCSPPNSTSTPVAASAEAAPMGHQNLTPEPAPTARPTLSPSPASILLTPTDKFYKQSFSTIPIVDSTTWRLVVDGLVKKPLTFTLDDIRALPAVEIMRTLECIGNPVGGSLIGNAIWKGAYLKPLLAKAGIDPSATRIKFAAADGYDTAVELRFIDDPRSFLAYEMNGEPLRPEHGFPMRVFFAGSYGQKMPKWVTQLELIDSPHEGYWEQKGWSDVAQVKTNSIIEQPHASAKLTEALIPLWGVAYAGQRAIVKVELQIDGEDWREAALLTGPSNEVWTQWALDWQPASPGSHKIAVRATDESGFVQRQSAGLLNGFPNGNDAIHSIFVTIGDA